MDDELRKRRCWVQLYERAGNAGKVCCRRGISRPTLRKWWQRYQDFGIDGLKSRARNPRRFSWAQANEADRRSDIGAPEEAPHGASAFAERAATSS